MQLIPAIDICNGACVRLKRGDFDAVTVYSDDPLAPARQYAGFGAPLLHVVDLDGARDGRARNTELMRSIAALCPVQTGGGLRSAADVAELLENGAARAVVGSIAVTEPSLVRALLRQFGPERIVLAVDVRRVGEEYVAATHGWARDSTKTLHQVLGDYVGDGLKHVLITDIDRDGMLSGPNLELYHAVTAAFPQLAIQASGGVSDLADLEMLANCGVAAAISGKALLEQQINAEEMVPYWQNA